MRKMAKIPEHEGFPAISVKSKSHSDTESILEWLVRKYPSSVVDSRDMDI